MGKSAYPPGRRIPVPVTASTPGAPRVRRSALHAAAGGKSPFARDRMVTAGHNPIGSEAHVWGSRVAPVTGRKSNKRPGWESRVAGGSHIVAPGV